jgi:hypothetical protein
MAEERRVVETRLPKDEAFKKCFKRAGQLGLDIVANIPGQRLEVRKVKRTAGWWCAVIFGFLFYIVPGVLVLVFWKPVETCTLVFDEHGEGTTVTAQVSGKGEGGLGFYNEVAGILI